MRPSRQAALWLLIVHAAGIAVLPFVSLPLWMVLLVLPMTGISLRRSWSRHVTLHRAPLRSFIWRQDWNCEIVDSAGCTGQGVVLPQAFVMPWLVILYIRVGTRRHCLFLLPDMLPAVTFRRLRVRLLIQSVTSQPRLAHGR